MDNKLTPKQRRDRLTNSVVAMKDAPITKVYAELLHLMLDQKVSILIDTMGEEAIALRGEIRCIKRLLSVMEQGNTPFTDSI